MIFNKDVTFPYPVLTNKTDDYGDNTFYLDLDVSDDADVYKFKYTIEIGSQFIINLLQDDRASLWIVFQTKDNYFKKINSLEGSAVISKKDISLHERSSIQVIIQANTDIEFKNNNDLNDFYHNYKEKLIIEKNKLLGFSNDLRFDGNLQRPLEIFEKKIDETIQAEIKIELREDVILIIYKNEDYQFKIYPEQNSLNNMYVYIGLSRALEKFIQQYGQDGDVDFTDFAQHEIVEELNLKLYNLMINKDIISLYEENIDEVISKITDGLVSKYVQAVGRLNVE